MRDHRRIAEYIEGIAGIQLPEEKHNMMEGRLRRCMRRCGLPDLHAYVTYVLDDPDADEERGRLLDALTTNKTDFYREVWHFEFLRRHIGEVLRPQGRAGWRAPLRVWSAGCSTGEEPYTLALEMLDMKRQMPGFNFKILATDISPSCLETARQGVYPMSRIDPVPQALRDQYMLHNNSKDQPMVKMKPVVQEHVTFRSFNLLGDEYRFDAPLDVIICRNVMIYFDAEDCDKILGNFIASLAPGGVLIIGHSEKLADDRGIMRQVSANRLHQRRRPAALAVSIICALP